jgi:hypothetical protein
LMVPRQQKGRQEVSWQLKQNRQMSPRRKTKSPGRTGVCSTTRVDKNVEYCVPLLFW